MFVRLNPPLKCQYNGIKFPVTSQHLHDELKTVIDHSWQECLFMLVCERLVVARGEFAAVSPRGRGTKTHLLTERIKCVCGRKTEVQGGRRLT